MAVFCVTGFIGSTEKIISWNYKIVYLDGHELYTFLSIKTKSIYVMVESLYLINLYLYYKHLPSFLLIVHVSS